MSLSHASGSHSCSGFLDEKGSTAAWYLQGKLSSDAALVNGEAAEFQRQQGTLRRARRGASPPGPMSIRNPLDGESNNGGDAIGKFLQRLAEASGTPSSMLGGLPEDDPPPEGPADAGALLDLFGGGEGGEGDEGGAGGEQLESELLQQQQQQPHLVLFARAKGRPFVYCGEPFSRTTFIPDHVVVEASVFCAFDAPTQAPDRFGRFSS